MRKRDRASEFTLRNEWAAFEVKDFQESIQRPKPEYRLSQAHPSGPSGLRILESGIWLSVDVVVVILYTLEKLFIQLLSSRTSDLWNTINGLVQFSSCFIPADDYLGRTSNRSLEPQSFLFYFMTKRPGSIDTNSNYGPFQFIFWMWNNSCFTFWVLVADHCVRGFRFTWFFVGTLGTLFEDKSWKNGENQMSSLGVIIITKIRAQPKAREQRTLIAIFGVTIQDTKKLQVTFFIGNLIFYNKGTCKFFRISNCLSEISI